eukprot:m51a1_g10145 hypothetical protein (288) ;mRNA; f:72834-73697
MQLTARRVVVGCVAAATVGLLAWLGAGSRPAGAQTPQADAVGPHALPLLPLRVACIGDDSTAEAPGANASWPSVLESLLRATGRVKPQGAPHSRLADRFPLEALHSGASGSADRFPLTATFFPHTVLNAGVASATLAYVGTLPWRATPQAAAAFALRPHVAVVMLGGADVAQGAYETPDAFRRHLAALVSELHALREPRPLVYLCVPPAVPGAPPEAARVAGDVVPALVREVARASGAAGLVDVFGALGGPGARGGMFAGGGAGLSAEGCAAVAREVLAALSHRLRL